MHASIYLLQPEHLGLVAALIALQEYVKTALSSLCSSFICISWFFSKCNQRNRWV